MKIVYYRVRFSLTSPLAVGSGENITTDKDIIRNSIGRPYIPAAAVAGVLRGMLDREKSEKYFGSELMIDNELTPSRVITYDANLADNSGFYASKRDMVALDEYKTAKNGAKFDFEIVEPGAAFVTYFEQHMEEGDEDVIGGLLADWAQNGLSFGAKTMRGYGLTKLLTEQCARAEFDLEQAEEKREWLCFDLYEDAAWTGKTYAPGPASAGRFTQIALELELDGGLSIREYSTEVGQADYSQMVLHGGEVVAEQAAAVIPGTSWAGAFRHQMRKLGYTEEKQKAAFGQASRETGVRSRVSFSESYLTGGKMITYSRNAIDRFTGGAVDKALYTEQTYYNGSTTLTIRIDKEGFPEPEGKERYRELCQYLAAAILDLHNGYLAVGGLSAVGRGIFRVTGLQVDGAAVETLDYQNILEALIAARK